MKVYTVEEVAAVLRVDYKTVLRLIERGLLKVLPGIRHKRITEEELKRYMDVRSTLSRPIQKPCTSHLPAAFPPASGKSTQLAENNKKQTTKGKAV
jgi:excisionase family DNA binding protein